MAENSDHSRKSLRTTGGKAPAKELVGRDSGDRTPEIVAAGQENEKNPAVLDTGGAHAVTIGAVPSLELFQVHPKGKSQFIELYRILSVHLLLGECLVAALSVFDEVFYDN